MRDQTHSVIDSLPWHYFFGAPYFWVLIPSNTMFHSNLNRVRNSHLYESSVKMVLELDMKAVVMCSQTDVCGASVKKWSGRKTHRFHAKQWWQNGQCLTCCDRRRATPRRVRAAWCWAARPPASRSRGSRAAASSDAARPPSANRPPPTSHTIRQRRSLHCFTNS